MAGIKAFKALRPSHDMAATIAALPYDVYGRTEAREYVEAHPHSFLAIDRPESTLSPDADMYADSTYDRAEELLSLWIREGSFIRESEDCLYLYELTMNGRSQTGIVGCAFVDEYDSGVIKKHENTLAAKEEDRVHHIDTTSTQTGPIFLAYRHSDVLSDIVLANKESDPIYDFETEDGIGHRVWRIADPAVIAAITEGMAEAGDLYIADGHHRAASAVRVSHMRRDAAGDFSGEEEYNYFLSVMFPDDELFIMDYNRVVSDTNGYDTQGLLLEIEKCCDRIRESESPVHPEHKGEFALYISGKWILYSFKDSIRSDDAVAGLDVSILQEHILTPVLGIGDPRTDERIRFVGGIRGYGELEKQAGTDGVAFAMYPTSMSELLKVADEGRLMPPKSTWFEPKLLSGLFLHEIERI